MTEQQIIDQLITREGGWVFTNRRLDLGGPTYAGVTLNTYNDWREKRGEPPVSPDVFERAAKDGRLNDDVYQLYAEEFLRIFRDLPERARIVAFDISVMSGLRRGVKILQKAVCDCGHRVAVDGIFGPATRAAAINAHPDNLQIMLAKNRANWYVSIVKSKPQQISNLNGWINRTFNCMLHG